MNHRETKRVKVIDSHTGGEPTRIVMEGAPDLGSGTMRQRWERFASSFDTFRSAVVNEPRGYDAIVGGLLCEPSEPGCSAGVLYFNNAGCIQMCIHGTIGLAVTLAHAGLIQPGVHRIDTPVGVVTATLHDNARVTVTNVPCYRSAAAVQVQVEGYGVMHGDIAWGGNWFFLVNDHQQQINASNIAELTHCAWAVRHALEKQGITGADGGVIDHIELFGPPSSAAADSRNFVLCPGGAYDRSPCGTGTSAKLACLQASGTLQPGQVWRQESVIGSIFEGTYQLHGQHIIPSVTGEAFVNAESVLLINPADPFAYGVRV